MKYRSLTHIYFMRSIFVSQWPIIPSMTFIYQIVPMTLGKITPPWNIGYTDLHFRTENPMSYGWLMSNVISLEGVAIKEKQCKTYGVLVFLPPAQPRGKNLWKESRPSKVPKYECYLMSGWRDIPTWRNFNVKLWCKFYKRDGRTNGKTKTIPLGINARDIIRKQSH